MKLLSLSNYIPEQICDTVKFTGYKGSYNISHYCGYVADFISKALEDDTIDGAVFPKSCDSCRVIPSYMGDTNKFIHQLHIPGRRDDLAVEYFASNIKLYQNAIEKYFDARISNIEERSHIINTRNAGIKKIYDDIYGVSYSEYISSLHEMFEKSLTEQKVPLLSERKSFGKPVYVIGSTLTDVEVLREIEESGLKIVGDRLPESKRLFSAPEVMKSSDIYFEIAKSIVYNMPSPTSNCFDIIIDEDITEIKDKAVKGVIFLTQKYCEPYDYLLLNYERAMVEINVPVLKLTVLNSTGIRNTKLSIEAFADMI